MHVTGYCRVCCVFVSLPERLIDRCALRGCSFVQIPMLGAQYVRSRVLVRGKVRRRSLLAFEWAIARCADAVLSVLRVAIDACLQVM